MDKKLKNILGLVFVFAFVFLGAFALTNTALASSCTITTTLKLGSKGNDVKCLQTNLNIKADGSFGPKTKIAVIAWQKIKGLTADGIFGAKSRAIFVSNTTTTVSGTFLSGCTSTSGFSTSSGVSCLTGISTTPTTLKAGCTGTTGFSITTGLSCSSTVVTNTTPVFYGGGGGGGGGGSGSPAVITPTAINITAISGVTIPAADGTPTATIADTSEYTATISWNGNPTTFTGNTSYTAVITLTPKTNYLLTGIPANFFTVSGATATNSADAGVVTAIFPATNLKQLTISNPVSLTLTKPYDGNTTDVVTVGTLSGVIGTDVVTVSAVATYDTKNVGTTKTITVVYTLGGADLAKYIKPVDYTVTTGVITQIQLTIANPTLTTQKEYDRTTSAVVTAGALSGVVGGDTVTVSAVANYDIVNIGVNKTITTVYTLAGADAGNYIKPVDYVVYSGVITQKQLTITAPTLTLSKLYDRTTTAVVTAGALVGVAGSEDVSINTAVATYDTANVGTSKTITIVYSITGASAANYIKPVNYTTATGIITAIQLTIANPTLTTTKVYNGTTTAAVTAGALSGILSPDTVTVSAVATYDTALVGTGKTITVVYTLGGAQAGNYTKPVNYVVATGVITAIVVSAPAIAGVTAPVTGATPVTTTTAGTGYTGTVTWSGSPVTFASATAYTATITLTPATGYTFTGVSANFFTVSGATATNPVDSGIVSAVFPATATTIATAAIAGVTAPVTGATPTATITATTEYTATISWNTSPSTFAAGTVYTATITITPKSGYTLVGVPANFFTVSGATATNSINAGVVSALFPATQSYATVPSSIVLAVGGTAPVGGVTNVAIPAVGGTDTTGVITGWVVTTADKIKFTVTDGGSATSTITINGGAYTSGADYQVVPTTTLPSVVVTTTEAGKITAVRTFTIAGPIVGPDTLTYGVVIGADTKRWLDRNLGATQVATAFNDYNAYGSLFQWGRRADGHQLITHTTASAATPVNGNTNTLSSSDTPGDALFIKAPSAPNDWRSPQNGNLWQGVNGINNPCPTGFRLPTSAEQVALVTASNITNSADAYATTLKLTVGGGRNYSDASLSSLGALGYYWSSSVSGTAALYFNFNASSVTPATASNRAFGFTVRCVKD